MTIRLSQANLPALAARARVPSYDRAALAAGIVHFGVGNFHRAHQAVYLDGLMSAAATATGRWSAPAYPRDVKMRATSRARTGSTTVVEQDGRASCRARHRRR